MWNSSWWLVQRVPSLRRLRSVGLAAVSSACSRCRAASISPAIAARSTGAPAGVRLLMAAPWPRTGPRRNPVTRAVGARSVGTGGATAAADARLADLRAAAPRQAKSSRGVSATQPERAPRAQMVSTLTTSSDGEHVDDEGGDGGQRAGLGEAAGLGRGAQVCVAGED